MFAVDLLKCCRIIDQMLDVYSVHRAQLVDLQKKKKKKKKHNLFFTEFNCTKLYQ